MYCTRLQLSRVLLFLSGVFLCTLYQLTISVRLYESLPMPQIGEDFGEGSTLMEEVEEATGETGGLEEPLTATHELEPSDQTSPEMHIVHHNDTTSQFKVPSTTEYPFLQTANQSFVHRIYVAPEPPSETSKPAPSGTALHIRGEYPVDLFSVEERRRGWVILHIIGMMYMFVSLVVVCDEFFVPALGVITDTLAISDDVTGATLMAAANSTPRFFTSLRGVFIAHSNVGIGTIVGSAVFNILFVIGMCALFSREVLHLTWWPLFRDVSFYILGLILLIIFFLDNVIMWWESMMLVTCYTLYVIFMKFNVQIERAFKTQLHKHNNTVKVIDEEKPEKDDVSAGEDESGGYEDSDTDEDSTKNSDTRKNETDDNGVKEEDKKADKPLSLQWPDTQHKQVTYLFLLPIVFPLWLTLPNVRNQKSRKFFVITFLGSILWIAVFSYLFVWWAHQVGETVMISHHIITLLAAGTSNPDLITGVIVARKGLGNMAVSSSVGSNIFDITVGLPVPWLLYSFVHSLAPVAVSSGGLICATMLLFLMLLFAIISITSCKWKINKELGVTMLLLYSVFIVLCIMLQYHIIVCPLSVN